MANFQRLPGGQRISNQSIKVVGSSLKIGLWGYLDFAKKPLKVLPDQPGFAAKAGDIKGDVQEWLVTSIVSGTTGLDATTENGDVWDSVNVTFTGLPSPHSPGTIVSQQDKDDVFAAVAAGRIRGDGGQLKSVQAKGYYQASVNHRIVLADAMFPVLAALSRLHNVELLSLMRWGNGPHGKIVADDLAICSAMDIKAFDGVLLNLMTPEKSATDDAKVSNTINATAAIIGSLPIGSYGFGLTRPTSGAGGSSQPSNDVFMPKTDKQPNYKTWTDPQQAIADFQNADAKIKVGSAINMNASLSIKKMFMDGVDHFHLEVLSAKSAPQSAPVS